MNKQSKGQVVSDIRERIMKARAIFLTEYKGLKVGELTNLRRELRAKDGDLKIVKNTLFQLAAKGILPEIGKNVLTGSTAVMFSYGDPAAVAKQIVGFSKSHPFMVIKGGVFDNNFVVPDRVLLLATLPDRETLVGMLVNTLSAPISRFVYAVASPIAGLITVLNGIKQNKQTKN